ncbi:MAG: HNH endonuclease, partial [Bdellovibrionia bacterium]
DQKVSISNARMIAPILNSNNQERWLSAAASLSKRVLEKEIAKEHPKTIIQEQTRFISENRLELKVGISEKLEENLRRVQNMISSQVGTPVDIEETLQELVEFYIQKNDPVEKAKRLESRTSPQRVKQASKPVPGQVKALVNPRYIPAQLKRAVLLRDQNQCSYVTPNGTRCLERRWLDIHHVRPLAEGGQTSFENLKLICRGHHQMLHH